MAGGRQVERVNTLTLGFSIYIPKSLVLSIYKAIRQSLLLVFLLSRSQLSGGIYVHGYRYGTLSGMLSWQKLCTFQYPTTSTPV